MGHKFKYKLLATVLAGIAFASTTVRAQTSDVDALDETGATKLLQAAKDDWSLSIKYLLNDGPNVNFTDEYGWTPLMYAAMAPPLIVNSTSSKGVVFDGLFPMQIIPNISADGSAFLLEAGADPNISDTKGVTALMIAASLGRAEFVQVLLKHGAKVDAVDRYGASALTYAKRNGDQATIRALVKKKAVDNAKPDITLPAALTPIDVLPKRLNPDSDLIPAYPEEAKKFFAQGVVRFRVLIGPDGSVKKAILLDHNQFGMVDPAAATLRKLKFAPGQDNGKKVGYWLPVQIMFIIPGQKPRPQYD